MRKIREILRLHHVAELGVRAIGRSLGLSHSTVAEVLRRAEAAGLSWPLPEEMDDAVKRLVAKVNKKAQEAEQKAATEQPGAAAKPAVRLPENLRFHDLRHTFVSRSLQAGANPRAVSEIAGHHDPGFTLRRYAHALPEDMKEAVQRLAFHLGDSRRTAADTPER